VDESPKGVQKVGKRPTNFAGQLTMYGRTTITNYYYEVLLLLTSCSMYSSQVVGSFFGLTAGLSHLRQHGCTLLFNYSTLVIATYVYRGLDIRHVDANPNDQACMLASSFAHYYFPSIPYSVHTAVSAKFLFVQCWMRRVWEGRFVACRRA
jgi:hypothetical protein